MPTGTKGCGRLLGQNLDALPSSGRAIPAIGHRLIGFSMESLHHALDADSNRIIRRKGRYSMPASSL
ncbi:MAG: hypothetical protein ACM3TN_21930 [Alphaproteobacteria bacterium]